MSASIADLSSLTPPSDDGAIERALGELESKLCAWSDAMTQAQRALAGQLHRYADAENTPIETPAQASEIAPETESPTTDAPTSDAASEDPTEASEPVSPPDATADNVAILDRLSDAMRHSDHLAREIGVDDDSANATEAASTSDTTDDDEDMEELLATIDAEVAEQLRIKHAEAGGTQTMREICDAYFAEVTETERLLATLEPEVAKAIRVQYRLFNGRKSIRQLVDEYEPPKEGSKKRKSWWRG